MLHRSEGTTMDRTGPVLSEQTQVLRSAIPLVFGKVVLRVPAMILDHESIARHLGNDRGRSNGAGQSIAVDDRTLRNAKSRNGHGIQEQEVRRERQSLYGAPHCQPGRLKDIEAVNLSFTRRSNADAHCSTHDFSK